MKYNFNTFQLVCDSHNIVFVNYRTQLCFLFIPVSEDVFSLLVFVFWLVLLCDNLALAALTVKPAVHLEHRVVFICSFFGTFVSPGGN